MRKIILTESQINRIVEASVLKGLNERKVLKLGGNGNNSQMPPMPQEPMPPMGSEQDPSMMGGEQMPPMDDNAQMGGMDPNMGPDDGATAGDSDFDTNFDAGVEADEDTDPKKFIQQLTGKLSQTLSKFNNEQGEPDAGLCKYVANMIVKQAAKGLDDKDRKDIIKAINTTAQDDGEEPDEEMPEDGNENPDEMQEQPLQEQMFSKKYIRLMMENINPSQEKREVDASLLSTNNKKRNNSPFKAKIFK